MNNPYREIVREKLSSLQSYYRELAELKQITFEEYQANRLYKRSIERLLQLIVEAATDINSMVLKKKGGETAVDYYTSFIKMAEAKVFPMEFAREIAPYTGLRNIVVHEYQKIDDRLVHGSMKSTMELYLRYMEYLKEHLETVPE